jgi:sugar lactone lactonase YvrE
LLAVVALSAMACSPNHTDDAVTTIVPASPAVSPPITVTPAGEVRPVEMTPPSAALFDAATSTLVVVGPDPVNRSASMLNMLPTSGDQLRRVSMPDRVTAITGDDRGVVYASTRGGYIRVDVRAGRAEKVYVDRHDGTEFTAIARRADGKLVLGSADGAVYTLGSDTAVAAEVKIFSRVDALVTQGNTAVALDRGQTSVAAVDASGSRAQHALRAGEGATTLAADPLGPVLVADTRGNELLVFGTDPLMMRQRYPVRNAPYGVVATRTLAWVSLTATNIVVGYDLETGIPVEKVRYPTVRQPDVLAFDETTDTLFVVSASGDGVQVIKNAGRPV